MPSLDLIIGAIKARIHKWSARAGVSLNANQITDKIWMGGLNSPKKMASEGFTAVLDLREEDHPHYRNSLENDGIRYLNIKIKDGEGAPPDVLEGIVEWLEEMKNTGYKTLVHCNLGRGRGALAIAAYLIREGYSVKEAIDLIKKRRNVTYINENQLKALREFSKTN